MKYKNYLVLICLFMAAISMAILSPVSASAINPNQIDGYNPDPSAIYSQFTQTPSTNYGNSDVGSLYIRIEGDTSLSNRVYIVSIVNGTRSKEYRLIDIGANGQWDRFVDSGTYDLILPAGEGTLGQKYVPYTKRVVVVAHQRTNVLLRGIRIVNYAEPTPTQTPANNDPTEAPVASFTANPTSGTYPLTVNFIDTSSNTPTSWNWDFGDGGEPSAEQNPTHIYTTEGTFHVSLTATNNIGSGTSIQTTTITSTEKVIAPEASFEATPTIGAAPLEVQFTDTSSNTPTSWNWDFGDGGDHSAEQNPTHSYATPGTYEVILTVKNSADEDTSDPKTISVTVPLPVASFTANHLSGDSPLKVKFTDQSTGSGIYKWDWDFGDGGDHSAEQNPTHTYITPDTYDVTLTATNDGGSDTSPSQTITVTQPKPVVTHISPNHWINGGWWDKQVTITGTGFIGVTGVKFGSQSALPYTVNSPTQITATAPWSVGVPHHVDVRVTTSAGTSAVVPADIFSYWW